MPTAPTGQRCVGFWTCHRFAFNGHKTCCHCCQYGYHKHNCDIRQQDNQRKFCIRTLADAESIEKPSTELAGIRDALVSAEERIQTLERRVDEAATKNSSLSEILRSAQQTIEELNNKVAELERNWRSSNGWYESRSSNGWYE